MCTHSPIAKTIATPTRRLVAASSEWISVAGNTASRLTAKSALAAAKACVRRIRATTRTAGICAMTTKDVLTRMMIPIAPGPTGVWVLANGGRMLEKNTWPTTMSTMLAAITVRKSRSRATARKPVPLASVARDDPGSRDRHGSEHDQREPGEGDSVEEIENLERAEPLCGCDDEAGYGRAGTNTEVARDAAKRDGGRSLLGLDQRDDQYPVGRSCRAEPGSAGNRAGKRLPGTVYVGEAGVAKGARQASCDHDRFGGVPVEQRSRRRGGDCGRPHGRRENQSGCRR